ncbi:MAG: hypothetical protein AMK75_05710, partial [Planctomycetes bacterium SM23_65]
LKQLADKDKNVGYRAIRILRYLRDDRAVGPLIDWMEKHKDYGSFHAVEALKRITGQDFGANPDAWRRWWQASNQP